MFMIVNHFMNAHDDAGNTIMLFLYVLLSWKFGMHKQGLFTL